MPDQHWNFRLPTRRSPHPILRTKCGPTGVISSECPPLARLRISLLRLDRQLRSKAMSVFYERSVKYDVGLIKQRRNAFGQGQCQSLNFQRSRDKRIAAAACVIPLVNTNKDLSRMRGHYKRRELHTAEGKPMKIGFRVRI